MCFSTVARLHQRLFKPASRCEAMRLTAVSSNFPPWLLTDPMPLEIQDSKCNHQTHSYTCSRWHAHKVHNIPSLLWPAVVIYTIVICFFLHKLLQCTRWNCSCTGVKVPTTSSVLLFFCVEDVIQEDLGVGEVWLRSVLGLATRSVGCAKSWFC